MIKFVEAKKTYIIALSILFVLVSLSDTTYSLFINNNNTNDFSYNTGLLDLQFVEDTKLTLESAFPIIDSEALSQKPYTLTIKNIGTLPYLFDLQLLQNEGNNNIDSKYIKIKVNNDVPHTLYYLNNIISSNIIIYPNEEKTFNINIWLDIDTPNTELNKTFSAKAVTTGYSIYKTIDSSGANHPILKENMLPVYYDSHDGTLKKADSNNIMESYGWYNYDLQHWANSIQIVDTPKQIYDITNNHNIQIDKLKVNNDNVIIDNTPLELGLANYNSNDISNIIRIKFNDTSIDQIPIISNGVISYYYDNVREKFVFQVNDNIAYSTNYKISSNTWYILGYTYDKSNVSFYVNGDRISEYHISGNINSSNPFKLGSNINFNKTSNITVGDIYFYNKILSPTQISNNYKSSISIIYDNLISGYNKFTPLTKQEYYMQMPIGSQINLDDIISYYVWIPRFKYKLWNVTGENNVDTYDAYNKGIDIIFEKDNTSSGTIYCQDSTCYSDELLITKVTSNDNNKYLTHPAFRRLSNDITGFWVSKYELSTSSNNCNTTDKSKCTNTDLSPLLKPNTSVWTNNYLSNFYQIIKKNYNDDTYHLIKNTEWGAITYLSHSKYGLCQNNKCLNPVPNNELISGKTKEDTTTGNIYGVYDMAGSAYEFVMANYTTDNQELSLGNTHFQNIPISNDDYDIYKNDNFILGDATKELTINNGTWYNQNNIFINNINNWFIRGGVINNSNTGIYSYSATNDISNEYITTRVTIR